MSYILIVVLFSFNVLINEGTHSGPTCEKNEIFPFMVTYGWETPENVTDLVLNNWDPTSINPFPFADVIGDIPNEGRRNNFVHRKRAYDYWRGKYNISFDENIEGMQLSSNFPTLYVFPIAINLNYEYKIFSYSDPERKLIPNLKFFTRYSVPITNAYIDDIAWFVFKLPGTPDIEVIDINTGESDGFINDLNILVYGSYRFVIKGENGDPDIEVTDADTDIYYFSAEVFNFIGGGGIECVLEQRDLGLGKALGFGAATGTGLGTTKLVMTFPQSFQDAPDRTNNFKYRCNNLQLN